MSTQSFIKLRTSVFELVAQIPEGKVTTYKALAQAANTGPRVIGRVLHTNTDTASYPCHRVIKSDGTVATGYAFGGPSAQLELLQQEGVGVVNGRVPLELFLWKPVTEVISLSILSQE